jgi:Bacterial protein of unknown function (DUF916)
MRIWYSFIGRRTFLWLSMLTLIIALFLIEVRSLPLVYADDGPPAFDIRPLYTDPHNPLTRAYFIMNAQSTTHVENNSLIVTNVGSATGTVNLYPVDAFTAATGGIVFRARTDARLDVGTWIKLSQQRVTLGAGQRQVVSFQVIIPPHVRSGQHVGGIVAELTALQTFSAKNVHLHVQQLRVTAVQVNLPGTPIEKLVATGIRPDNSSIYQRLQIGLSNVGNMMLKPFGSLQISDLSGHQLQYQALRFDTFLPQTSITDHLYIQHKALPVGKYKASLILNYGHKQQLYYTTVLTITSSKKTFSSAIASLVSLGDTQAFLSIFSPWQLALGGFILLLLLCGLSFWLYKIFKIIGRLLNRGEKEKSNIQGTEDVTKISAKETVRAKRH